jgi:ADP-dependent NAD(P)H-hydrate dehydratase / NAD(P)H-hydrate epimerase
MNPISLALLSNEQMTRADMEAARAGIDSLHLMEQAGRAVSDAIIRLYPARPETLILCGPGNNGGDGYVVARLLAEAGWLVTTASAAPSEKLKGDAATNRKLWQGEDKTLTDWQVEDYGLIVDALFGAGLTRPIEGAFKQALQKAGESQRPLIAVDMPSGVSGSTGQVLGYAPQATHTITFCHKKPGHLLYPGRGLCGEVRLSLINIPDKIIEEINPRVFENNPALWSLPKPNPQSHKYKRGYGLIACGPLHQTGAARLAANACLRAGAGIVKIAAPKSAILVLAQHETEVMLMPCEDDQAFAALLKEPRLSALCIGPGLGLNDRAEDWLKAALTCSKKTVLDADALTLLARQNVTPPQNTILTPHEGEFERLFPGLLEKSQTRLEAAQNAAQKQKSIIVLKGADTIIAAPDGQGRINTSGTPWLASAGSGDVLAGIITSLLAQGMPPFDAASAGVFLHGKAGEAAGPYLIASDLIENLPQTMAGIIGQ